MQKIKISFVLIFGVALGLLSACSDEDYFTVDPITVSKTIDSDTYSYLASHPEQFAAFVEVIDLSNSKELINRENTTVLVPQNYSISRFVFEQGKKELSDFQPDELLDYLRQYVVRTRIVSEDLSDPISTENEFGHELVFEVKKEKWKGVDNIGPEYISVYNLKDLNDDKDDIQVKVVTPDLVTSTGIVQVLTNEHLFGF